MSRLAPVGRVDLERKDEPEVVNGFRVDRSGITLRFFLPGSALSHAIRAAPRFLLRTLPWHLFLWLLIGHCVIALTLALIVFGHPLYFSLRWVGEHFLAYQLGYCSDAQFQDFWRFLRKEEVVWSLPAFLTNVLAASLGFGHRVSATLFSDLAHAAFQGSR